MIFAVFDVLLAVNMCINYSFFFTFITVTKLYVSGDDCVGPRLGSDVRACAETRTGVECTARRCRDDDKGVCDGTGSRH